MREVADSVPQDPLIQGNNTLISKVDLPILVNSLMTFPDADPVTPNTLVTHPCTIIRNQEGLETMERTKNLGGIALDHRETALDHQGSTSPQPV